MRIRLLFLIAFLLLTTSCQKDFVGEVNARVDSFHLEVEYMNDAITQDIKLDADKPVWVTIEPQKGALNVTLTSPSGTVVYSGNGSAVSRFSINIIESGIYKVEVRGTDAKGAVDIRQKE